MPKDIQEALDQLHFPPITKAHTLGYQKGFYNLAKILCFVNVRKYANQKVKV